MTVRLKTYGECTTRKADLPPLCDSCKWSQRVKGVRRGDDFTECQALEKTIWFHVTECDAYRDKASIPSSTYEQIAWVRLEESHWITPAELYKGGKHIGITGRAILRRVRIPVAETTYDEATATIAQAGQSRGRDVPGDFPVPGQQGLDDAGHWAVQCRDYVRRRFLGARAWAVRVSRQVLRQA